MSQRSPHNDRYKVEQKGKTRKSASAAKPKRELADLTSATSKKAAPKKTRWGRGPARQVTPDIEPTPRMKRLRRIWWILWGMSLLIAVGILLLQKAGAPYTSYVSAAWGVWAAAMGGAFYMEFVPLRRARAEAIEAARHSKPSKNGKGKTGSKPVKDAPDDAE